MRTVIKAALAAIVLGLAMAGQGFAQASDGPRCIPLQQRWDRGVAPQDMAAFRREIVSGGLERTCPRLLSRVDAAIAASQRAAREQAAREQAAAASFVDARITPAAIRAPLASDPTSLPDFALFRECDGCPEMVVIPAGTFLMGSPQNELGRDDHLEDDTAGPGGQQVPVSVGRFALSRFPITRGMYDRYATVSGQPPSNNCYTLRVSGRTWETVASGSWRDPGFQQTDQHPVVCVSAGEGASFANWIGLQAGATDQYRLPTSAEYEFANRAGTTSAYFWGDNAEEVCAHANVADAAMRRAFRRWGSTLPCNDGYERTSPVGTFRANPWGLFDMTGNVYSWTNECFRYTSNCLTTGFRGGSWASSRSNFRSAAISAESALYYSDMLGFRLARDL